MKSKKHIIALIVAIIAIALFFFAHHYGWGTVFEAILLCVSFLAASYLLFFDSFVKTLGEETAKMMVLEEKTTIEEQIRIGFSKLLEEHKADLAKKNIAFGADYTLYITERTKVCDELYKKLVDLYALACKHTKIYRHAADIQERQAHFIGGAISNSKIEEYYIKNKIYLQEELSALIVGFILTLKEHCRKSSELFVKYRKLKEDDQERIDVYNQLIEISKQVDYMQQDLDKIADNISRIIQPEIEKQQS